MPERISLLERRGSQLTGRLKGQHQENIDQLNELSRTVMGIDIPPTWGWIPTPYRNNIPNVPGMYFVRPTRAYGRTVDNDIKEYDVNMPIPYFGSSDHVGPFKGISVHPTRLSIGGRLDHSWVNLNGHVFNGENDELTIGDDPQSPITLLLSHIEKDQDYQFKTILSSECYQSYVSSLVFKSELREYTFPLEWSPSNDLLDGERMTIVTENHESISYQVLKSNLSNGQVEVTVRFRLDRAENILIQYIPSDRDSVKGLKQTFFGYDLQKGELDAPYIHHKRHKMLFKAHEHLGVVFSESHALKNAVRQGTLHIEFFLHPAHVDYISRPVISSVHPSAWSIDLDVKNKRWRVYNPSGYMVGMADYNDETDHFSFIISYDQRQQIYCVIISDDQGNTQGVKGNYGHNPVPTTAWHFGYSSDSHIAIANLIYYPNALFDSVDDNDKEKMGELLRFTPNER